MKKKKAFCITSSKGFHITFPNGLTLSTQFGGGNYCENYNIDIGTEKNIKDGCQSNDCEIAIWDKDGEWLTKEMHDDVVMEESGDDVMGYVNIGRWLEIFHWCEKWKEASMKDCKIRVKNAEESKKVQKKLFDMGVRWLGGEKVIKDYPTPLFLYISENELLWDSLKENVTVYKNLPELTVSELLKGESRKKTHFFFVILKKK